MKGLSVEIYRNSLGDCTNNGLSSKAKNLVLVGEEIDGPVTITNDEDCLVLVHLEDYYGVPYSVAIPKSIVESGKRSMFGGNFCYTSDSRFPLDNPIKIFDRVER